MRVPKGLVGSCGAPAEPDLSALASWLAQPEVGGRKSPRGEKNPFLIQLIPKRGMGNEIQTLLERGQERERGWNHRKPGSHPGCRTELSAPPVYLGEPGESRDVGHSWIVCPFSLDTLVRKRVPFSFLQHELASPLLLFPSFL